MLDLRKAHKFRIDVYKLLPIQAQVFKGCPQEIAQTMRRALPDHIIFRHRLLEHRPHCLDVIARKSPVAFHVEIPEHEGLAASGGDGGGAVSDFTRDKNEATTRGFMVEENARGGEEAVTFPIVHRDKVAIGFRDAVWAARIKRGQFV